MTTIIPTSTDASWHPEPPGKGGVPTVPEWTRVAADLRAHPGQWRVVAAGAPSSTAAKIMAGQLAAFSNIEDGHFEAVLRGMDPESRRGTIWAAFIPSDPEGDREALADDAAEQRADEARYNNRNPEE